MGDGLQIAWTVAMAAPPPSSPGAHAHGKRAAARPPAKSQRTGKSAARDWKIALYEFGDDSTV